MTHPTLDWQEKRSSDVAVTALRNGPNHNPKYIHEKRRQQSPIFMRYNYFNRTSIPCLTEAGEGIKGNVVNDAARVLLLKQTKGVSSKIITEKTISDLQFLSSLV